MLKKSFDRYGKRKKLGVSDVLVDAEKVLMRRRLLFLFNIDTDITNQCQNSNIDKDFFAL
jgi:hypothetical protein